MANDNESGGKGVDPKAVEDLNKSLGNVKSAARDMAAAFDAQLKIIMQMRDAMAEVSKNMQDASDKMGGMSAQKMQQIAAAVEKSKSASKGWKSELTKLADFLSSKWTRTAVVATSAISGLAQGFRNLAAVTKGAFGLIGTIAGSLVDLGKAVLAVPFKMMDMLFGAAANAASMMSEIAEAREEVRESFGDLKSAASSAILDVSKSMAGFSDTGLSASSVFGTMAERIKFMSDMAKGLGPQINNFTSELQKNGGAIAGFQKGLGFTAEQMGAVADRARTAGTSMSKVLVDVTKQSQGMSKAFGLNAKIIAKDMGRAMQDLSHFAHLSTKEIGLAAAYANKLGISIDKLTSMMDATQTFDQAAEGMGKLNEQYGTNISATEVMMAQSPDEKFALIAKGFRDAGKDLTKLTYQDRAFIKAQSGMTDEALNAMIANKDAAAMHEKMAAAADKNEKKTLDQAGAMRELSSEIRRMVKVGAPGKGLLDTFFEGFSRGIQNSPEFLRLMHNINEIMRDAFRMGRQLGRMFVDLFPGVKQMLGGLGDIFDPRKFRSLFKEVIEAFDIFKKGGPEAAGKFLDRLGDIFKNFFDKEAPGGKKFLAGGETFLKTLGELLTRVAIKAAAVLGPPVEKLIVSLLDLLKKWWKDNWGSVVPSIAAIMFGPMLMNALLGAASSMLLKGAGSLVRTIGTKLGWITASAVKEGAAGAAGAASEAGGSLVKNLTTGVESATSAGQATLTSRLTGFLKTPVTGILKGGWKAILGRGTALTGAFLAGWDIGSEISEAAGAASEKTNADLNASLKKSNEKIDEIFDKNNPIESLQKARKEIDKQATEQLRSVTENRSTWEHVQDWMSGDFDAAKRRADEIEYNRDTMMKQLKKRAEAAKRESIVGTLEWRRKMDDENKKAIAAAEESQKKAIADLGPVTIENAAERFKKINDLAKRLMGKDFDIEDKLKKIREKLSSVNFSIFDKTDKEAEVNAAVVSLQRIQSMFTSLADIGGLMSAASERLKGLKSIPKEGIDNLKQSMLGIKHAFQNEEVSVYSAISATLQYLAGAFKSMPELVKSIGDMTAYIDRLPTQNKLNDKMNSLNSLMVTVGRMSGVNMETAKSSMAAISEMVASTQQLDEALSKLGTINLPAKLTAVAKGMGVGGKYSYTVQNKDIVINVNFQVTMDAGEVEKVMILRKESIVRDRINYLLKADEPALLKTTNKEPPKLKTNVP